MIDIRIVLEVVGLIIASSGIMFTGFRWMSDKLNTNLKQWREELKKEQKTIVDRHDLEHNKLSDRHDRLRDDVEKLKSDLPFKYVLKDDHVRQEAILNAKMDGLANKIDKVISHSAAEKP